MQHILSYCPIGSRRLAYNHAGTGPAVVFLHGIGGNRSNWDDQLAALAPEYGCVAWDAMGYGESDDSPDGDRFEHFSNELRALLDHLKVERAHLVGLSMGGHIALNFYQLYAERVATLTLTASSAGMGTLTAAAREDFIARRVNPLEAGQSLSSMAAALVGTLIGRRATAEIRARLQTSLATVRQEPYIRTVRAIVTTDFRPVLPTVRVPTLVIVGDEDRVLPLAESAYLAKHIPNAGFHVLPGVGHLCNMEARQEYTQALGGFLSAHKAAASALGGHR